MSLLDAHVVVRNEHKLCRRCLGTHVVLHECCQPNEPLEACEMPCPVCMPRMAPPVTEYTPADISDITF